MSPLGFGWDVQVIFLSAKLVDGYPTEDSWFETRGVVTDFTGRT